MILVSQPTQPMLGAALPDRQIDHRSSAGVHASFFRLSSVRHRVGNLCATDTVCGRSVVIYVVWEVTYACVFVDADADGWLSLIESEWWRVQPVRWLTRLRVAVYVAVWLEAGCSVCVLCFVCVVCVCVVCGVCLVCAMLWWVFVAWSCLAWYLARVV